MDDVKFVANKLVHVKRMVLRVTKIENNGVAPADWFTQFKGEESGGIGLGIGHTEIAGGY